MQKTCHEKTVTWRGGNASSPLQGERSAPFAGMNGISREHAQHLLPLRLGIREDNSVSVMIIISVFQKKNLDRWASLPASNPSYIIMM